MSKRVVCSKCGHDNEMSGIFCRECGEKLDFKNVQAEQFEKGRDKEKKRGAGMGFLRLIRLVVGLALVAVVGLMLWPTAPYGEVGTAKQAEGAKEKILELHDACESGASRQSILNEAELNAYMAMLIEKQNADGRTPSKMDEVNIVVSKSGVTVFTSMKIGPATITYTVEGKPMVGGGFRFPLDKVSVGHLPLPGPLGDFVSGQVGRIFSGMDHEKRVVDCLSTLEVAERRIRISTP